MNERNPIHFAPQLRGYLSRGLSMDDALTALKADGASIIECIIAVKEHTGCDLGKAKEQVSRSKTWRAVVEETNKMWDELLTENGDIKAEPAAGGYSPEDGRKTSA